MKNLVLFLLTLFFAVCVAFTTAAYAQEKGPDVATFNSVVDNLAVKLENGVKLAKAEVQPLAQETVRQYVEREKFLGYTCLVFSIIQSLIALILPFFLWKLMMKYCKMDSSDDTCGAYLLFSIGLGVIWFLALVASLCNIAEMINHIANANAPYLSLLNLLK